MPGIVKQTSSSPSPPRAPSPQRTNTVWLTSLPPPFFHPVALAALRDHFESYGEIHTWAPIRSFARIMVVYMDEDEAESAKINCDGLTIEKTSETAEFVLRVFRGDPTPTVVDPKGRYLHPPALEKNFLISPPGSPPVGWEPIKEDPPNSAPLADDLIVALRNLQVAELSHLHDDSLHGHVDNKGVEVLLHPEDGAGIGVYVEDCDVDEQDEMVQENDWAYGEDNPNRMQWKPMPTAMPP
ncbi:Calcipressin, partial [Stereum hirsutum FP-91666 SS1]|uniref:Calcipressin n=1 Tax=Stereum hirsutum (strain FP-91666) TaxID=721885 RepID=UPI000444A04D